MKTSNRKRVENAGKNRRGSSVLRCPPPYVGGYGRDGGFTLMELILILALLAIMTSLAAPSLSRFFRGRTIHSEARQLLSLTHAAQSRAVASGFPIVLWVDAHDRSYGFQEEGSVRSGRPDDIDPKAEEFTLHDDLEIEAMEASLVSVNGSSLPAIRFLPDGAADENSPTKLRLTDRSGETLWLIQTTNRLSYEISNSDR